MKKSMDSKDEGPGDFTAIVGFSKEKIVLQREKQSYSRLNAYRE